MAEPFSILAAAVGVSDVCWRIAKYLKDVRAAAATVQDDIDALIREVEALGAVNESIDRAFKADISTLKSTDLGTLWQHTGKTLKDCRTVIDNLERLVKDIYGKTGPKVVGKIDGLSKQSRSREKKAELFQIRDQLSTYQSQLQILLAGINMYVWISLPCWFAPQPGPRELTSS
jgi:hypothetical protein